MGFLTKTSTNGLSAGALILRLMLGSVMFAHGAQKVLGIWGGKGLDATVTGMAASLGVPSVLAYAAAFSEFLGGALLMIGLWTRISSVFVAITMMVAVLAVHLSGGFFASNKGFEYPLTLAAMAIALLFTGPGKFSIDALLSRRSSVEALDKVVDPAVNTRYTGPTGKAIHA